MVDHKTRVIEPHELIENVERLNLKHEELRRKVCGLDTVLMQLANANLPERVRDLENMIRSGSTPAQRLVPRDVLGPTVSAADYTRVRVELAAAKAMLTDRENGLHLAAQTARDHLAKIEELETELADAKVDLDFEQTNAALKTKMAEEYEKENTRLAKLAELADSRLAAANNLRRDLNEMNLKLNGKTTALANSERELAEVKSELRRVDGMSARRRAVAAENEVIILKAQLAEVQATVSNRDRTIDALTRTVESLRQEIADLRDGGAPVEPTLPGLL